MTLSFSHLLLFLSVLVCVNCNSQKRESCYYILNESVKVKIQGEDSVCGKLEKLTDLGLSLRFFLRDEQILSAEKKRYAEDFFSTAHSKKNAIVFINVSTKDFTALFSDSLKGETYLIRRKDFQAFVYKKMKTMDENFFSDITSEYQRLFAKDNMRTF